MAFGKLDTCSKDKWESTNYGLPSALYFYYLNTTMGGYEDSATAVLGNCSAIQSIQYVPFINQEDLSARSIPYDIERFGITETIKAQLKTQPRVYRIVELLSKVKTLGGFTVYNTSLKDIGGNRNWRNESRLYNYPYQFATLTDHLNSPLEIKYHLCRANPSTIKVINTISDRCSYGLYVEGYKNDDGKMEALVSGDGHELPCSSSAYNQWYATSKNQVNQNVQNMASSIFLQNQNIDNNLAINTVGSAIGAITGVMTGNYLGAISSVTGGISNYVNATYQKDANNLSLQNQIKSNMAQVNDLKSTPNTMISMGSNVYYGLANGDFQLDLYRYGLTEEYYNKIGDYFAMFGYKQNKVMNVNTQDRYYYNYIKTIGANISGDKIPRARLEEIKSIFDNGVTIWHTFRDNVVVGDYSKDNYEI